MLLSILIGLLAVLVTAYFLLNTSAEYEDCAVCRVGVPKSSLIFANLKGVGWTIGCQHCVDVHGVDETPAGKVLSIKVPYLQAS